MRKQMQDEMIEKISVLEMKFRQIKDTAQTAMFITCVVLLQNIKKKCAEALPENRISFYVEVFDGILLALQKREKMNRENLNEVCDLCTELLQFVKKELLKEKITKEKKEILFLPYKASMWDSLESIWRAAAADKEHCEANVMPIPYCDRNPDGSAAQWHCEADLFPEDVPVIDYREYDLKKRRPDVIYIHNPYDEMNSVTSVDPQYYSYELKKYTDTLVYVPYFILGNRWPEVQAKLSCYEYMDKMVIQHDKMQIDPMQGSNLLEGEIKYLSDYIPKEKLLPLGSPKADRMFFCEMNKKVPLDWRKIIQGKKVILYNISISGLLQHGDRILNKMKYIFSAFAERNDIALLWRPHPLLESTMKSMRPDLYDKYINLKNVFIKNRIGIFDETPDINMAVAIADAYLGESGSSIVNLFGIAGKPIFFTDDVFLWATPTAEEQASVLFTYMHVEDDFIWFVADGYNTFCRMHIPTGYIEDIVKFDDFPVNSVPYSGFAKIQNQVIFAPLNEQAICMYNLETKKISKVFFNNPLSWGNFNRAVSYKQYVFLIPLRYEAILRLDSDTGECKYYSEYMETLKPYQSSMHEEFFGIETRCADNILLIPCLQINKILEFNMETEEFSFHDLPKGNYDCWQTIPVKNDEYWLIPWKTSSIRKWNKKENTCEVYNNYPKNYKCMEEWFTGARCHFIKAVNVGNEIILFPCFGNMILSLDTETGEIEEKNIHLPYSFYERKSNFYLQQPEFYCAELYKYNKIIAFSAYDRSLLIYDSAKDTLDIKPCRFSEDQRIRLQTAMEKSFGKIGSNVLYASNENHLWRNIDSYIEYVISEKHNFEQQRKAYLEIIKNADGTCGEKVHQYIMEQMADGRS